METTFWFESFSPLWSSSLLFKLRQKHVRNASYCVSTAIAHRSLVFRQENTLVSYIITWTWKQSFSHFSSLCCVREARGRGVPLRRGSESECIDVRRKLDARARLCVHAREARDVPSSARSLRVCLRGAGGRAHTQLGTAPRDESKQAGGHEKSTRTHGPRTCEVL